MAGQQVKDAKDAKVGDKVWVMDYNRKVCQGSIHSFFDQINIVNVKVGDHPYTYSIPSYAISMFGVGWGFWESRPDSDQTHVYKQSLPEKRTAKHAKLGDDVWVFSYAHKSKIEEIGPDQYVIDGLGYLEREFGFRWGFWEDRPDWVVGSVVSAHIPSATDSVVIQPSVDEEKPLPPQLRNIALLINAKGLEWVKANAPDAWNVYKAVGMDSMREQAHKLNKPKAKP